jgi:hypothetical protein
MKKLFLSFLLMFALALPAYAITPAFDKEKLEFGVEYGYSHQDIEEVNNSINGLSLNNTVSNVKEWSFLATMGYKINDAITPYMILGDSYLNLDQEITLNGYDVLVTQFRAGSGLLVGGGAKGTLLSFNNGVKFGYDTRWTTFNTTSTERDATLLGKASVSNKMKASLGEFKLDLIGSKYFDLTKTDENGTVTKKYFVQGITPFLGGRWTHSDLNVKNSITSNHLNVGTETEYQGNMLSAVGGVTIKVNKNWNTSIGGIIGQENGVQVKVGYNF